MATTYPAAMFSATRDELLGLEPLPAAAEIARGVCRGADLTVSVLAITSSRMRRVDGWSDTVGFVTHAAGDDPGLSSLGSVCDCDHGPMLVREIIGSLVGDLPPRPTDTLFEMPALSGLTPASLPDDIDRVVVLTVASSRIGLVRLAIAAGDGLAAGAVGDVDHRVRLDPVDPAGVDSRIAEVLGAPPRSVRDLLLDD